MGKRDYGHREPKKMKKDKKKLPLIGIATIPVNVELIKKEKKRKEEEEEVER